MISLYSRLRRQNLLGILVLLSVVILQSGCSKSPRASLGKQTLQNIVTSQSDGRIKVTEFDKTNGIAREIAGQRIHTMEYTATIRFQKPGWKGGDAFVGYFSSFAVADTAPAGWEAFGKNWKFFEKNAEVQLTGEIIFEDTENGWRPKDVNVKAAKVLSNAPDEEYYDQFVGLWANRAAYPAEMKIVKEGGQYKLLNRQYNNAAIILHPENQSLNFRELDMPVYLKIDPETHQLRSAVNSYSKIDDEAAYATAQAAIVPIATKPLALPAKQTTTAETPDVFVLRAVIEDSDGYSNVRKGPAVSSDLLGVVRLGEEFRTFQQTGDWWQVKISSGQIGYMHASRIKIRK
jgi:hypothetical protein